MMKKVITYGTFDLLHEGHVNLLRRAKELGDYFIVGVTSDSFDADRGKLNVRNNLLERVEAVRATGYADEIIIENYIGQKIDDILRNEVDVFAVGSDWEGQFDYLNEYCQVVYLPRTSGISSTMPRSKSENVYRAGIVGSGRIARRFVPETDSVAGLKVTAVYDPCRNSAEKFASEFGIACFHEDFDGFLEQTDAVYIASPHQTHYEYARRALHAGRHVLCEIPLVLSAAQASELYDYAQSRNLVFLEASKTAFCPSFNHLVSLVRSGIIGDVVDVKASLSKLVTSPSRELEQSQCGGAVNEHAPLTLMAIIKLLGLDYRRVGFYSRLCNGIDIYTKIVLDYPHATSCATLGVGVKTEGSLVVSGTRGYVYVPAPWWLTSFFEVRYEDRRMNRKFFYSFDGEGLRYEIREFVSMIAGGRSSSYKLSADESIAIAQIIERFNRKENFTAL